MGRKRYTSPPKDSQGATHVQPVKQPKVQDVPRFQIKTWGQKIKEARVEEASHSVAYKDQNIVEAGVGTSNCDPDVVELCDRFHIEDEFTIKLHNVLQAKNPIVRSSEVKGLWGKMKMSRNPQRVLNDFVANLEKEAGITTKMHDGKARFPVNPGRMLWAKINLEEKKERKKMDAYIEKEYGEKAWDPAFCMIVEEFDLDKMAQESLAKILMPFPPGRRHAYYIELRSHLQGARGRASATAMRCLPRIKAGSSLGPAIQYKRKDKNDTSKDLNTVVDRGREIRDRARAEKAMLTGDYTKLYESQLQQQQAELDQVREQQEQLEEDEEEAAAEEFTEGSASLRALATRIEEHRQKNLAAAPADESAPTKATSSKRDAKSEYLMKKFDLDEESVKCLAEAIGKHPKAKRKEYYVDLALHLESSKRPSGTVMRLVEKIKLGEPLGDADSEDEEDDMEIEHFQLKYQFDEAATTSLAEAVAYHDRKKRQSYYMELEQVLDEKCDNGAIPAEALAEVVPLIKKGEPLLMPWLDSSSDDDDDADAP